MKFKDLAIFFDKINQTTSRLKITEILADLFNKLTPQELEKTVYLLQGRLGPLYQKIDFGMAERLVIKSICLALNLDQKFFEKKYKELGDLGETVVHFKKEIISFEQKDFSINEIYQQLLALASASGEGSQEFKVNLLADLIRRSDFLSAKYLVRIPLGIMRLGFSDMTILDSLSWMLEKNKSLRKNIEAAYHVRPDLGFIARHLKEKGISSLSVIQPKIFTPIIMMRAERLSSAQEIIKKIGNCAVQPKYDGFRLQIHYQKIKDQKKVNLYSRSLEEVTFMYPDIVEAVKKEISCESIIFEGEAIGYDLKTKKFLPFQETVQRKRKFDIDRMSQKIPLKVFVFELIYYNQKNYLNLPYLKRRKKLEEIVKKDKKIEKDNILLTPETITGEEREVQRLFLESIKQGLEGIIAKKLDGVYQPGARNWNWIKFKESYSSKINDTIDCLIMGYDFGKGKRSSFGIGAFLVGVHDEKNDQFLTVAKIGTGLTDNEWQELRTRVKNLELKVKPKNYLVNKLMNCDVWLSPSLVVEIRADEITKSPVHTAMLALRFPRLERFRDDKKIFDITTLSELRKIYLNQKSK